MSIEELIQQGQQAIEAERRRREAEEAAQAEADALAFKQSLIAFLASVANAMHPNLLEYANVTGDHFEPYGYAQIDAPGCAPIRFVMRKIGEDDWSAIDRPYIVPIVTIEHDNYNHRIDGFIHAEAAYAWRDYTEHADPALALAEAVQRLEEFEKARKEAVQETIKAETRLAELEDAERQSKADPTLDAILSIRKGTKDTLTLIFTYIAEDLHIANAIARDRMDWPL